jgi:predicted nucleotidyltransferase
MSGKLVVDAKVLKNYFEHHEGIVMAFLFGSSARSKNSSESDIDIAIYTKGQINETKLWCELERLVKREVDLVILNRAIPTIAWEAIRGIPLVIKDRRLYLDFMLNISREAEDLIEFNLDMYGLREKLRCQS